ncbi:MAG: hypothetical protein ACPGR8_15235 [Limisphaerales bacterium]
MDKELSECLDPPLLLHLYSLDPNPDVATSIGHVLAGVDIKNLHYFRDVVKTWAKHTEAFEPEKAADLGEKPGLLRWFFALESIEKMPTHTLPPMNPVYVERLLKILCRFSEKCTFGRLGDTFVKDSICAEIPPALFASMGKTEAPYAKSKAHYGDDMNDIVNDLIRTPPAARVTRTDWKNSRAPTDFIFAACLLLELMGQEKLAKMVINHEVCIYNYRKATIPHLCVLEKRICMLWGENLFYVDEGTEYPAITLCFHWVRCAALVGDNSARSVQCAVQTPSKLSARDPIYSYV